MKEVKKKKIVYIYIYIYIYIYNFFQQIIKQKLYKSFILLQPTMFKT